MNRFVLVLVSIILFISCGGNEGVKPKHLLSEDEMANVIYDINIAQAIRAAKPQLLDDNDIKPKNYIYKKYKIDSLTFAQNNAWYSADMENYEKIQKRVSDRIKKERDALKPKKDSIKPKKLSVPGQRAKHDSLRKAALDRQQPLKK